MNHLLLGNDIAALAHFASLSSSAGHLRWNRERHDCFESQSIATGLVALLRRVTITGVMGSDGYREVGDRVEWRPSFWDNALAANTALRVLLEGVDDPVVWAMGQYESTEFDGLVGRGLVPPDLRPAPLPPHKVSIASYILRIGDVLDIPYPSQQGNGHFPGIRLAVFPRADEPVSLYDEWLGNARAGASEEMDPLLESDDCAPVGAIAWMSPSGVENRQSAAIGRLGMSPTDVVSRLALELGVPLLVSQCSVEEYSDWEWGYDLPDDLERQLGLS